MGQTTGFSCGTVTLVTGSLINCNAAQKKLIPIGNCGLSAITLRRLQLKQDHRDSGGPYFDASGKAYGIASAGITKIGDTSGVDISSLKHLNGFQLKIGK